MSYLNDENESLIRELASLERDLYQTQRELVSLGALITETVAWGKQSIGNPSFHDRNFETVILYRALDYIQRGANNAVRRGGCSHMSAEHVKGEATPTEDIAKWLGWDKETPTPIKLDADATYSAEELIKMFDRIGMKVKDITFHMPIDPAIYSPYGESDEKQGE